MCRCEDAKKHLPHTPRLSHSAGKDRLRRSLKLLRAREQAATEHARLSPFPHPDHAATSNDDPDPTRACPNPTRHVRYVLRARVAEKPLHLRDTPWYTLLLAAVGRGAEFMRRGEKP